MSDIQQIRDTLMRATGLNVIISGNVQPPCIKLTRSTNVINHANNKTYMLRHSFNVLLLDVTNGTEHEKIVDNICSLPYVTMGREYIINNVVHTTFEMYK